MNEEKTEWTFPDKTPEELRQLAADIYESKVFTDRHIKPSDFPDMMGSIFMPIVLGAFSKAPKEYLEQIGMFYEYMSEAGPRAVNGYPSFFSFKVINREQAEKVDAAYIVYKDFKEQFVSTGPSGTEL